MREADTIGFYDEGSKQEGTIIVRYDPTQVAVCVTLRNEGDLEVFLNKPDARRLIKALQIAVNFSS